MKVRNKLETIWVVFIMRARLTDGRVADSPCLFLRIPWRRWRCSLSWKGSISALSFHGSSFLEAYRLLIDSCHIFGTLYGFMVINLSALHFWTMKLTTGKKESNVYFDVVTMLLHRSYSGWPATRMRSAVSETFDAIVNRERGSYSRPLFVDANFFMCICMAPSRRDATTDPVQGCPMWDRYLT